MHAHNTLHVLDNESRLSTVRVGHDPEDSTPGSQFHIRDHLGSTAVLVDQKGAWINREEYTPYGETSFGSFSKKRYRFAGKERDGEEQGEGDQKGFHAFDFGGRVDGSPPDGFSSHLTGREGSPSRLISQSPWW